ncbi:hypothetical protein PybrP1_010760 [[Pythium] brassicae (nom. inval.)]|nr:hypothetical protein PybrP1_010760 [[Pythium] brassicae (nom. inval.)]
MLAATRSTPRARTSSRSSESRFGTCRQTAPTSVSMMTIIIQHAPVDLGRPVGEAEAAGRALLPHRKRHEGRQQRDHRLEVGDQV